MRPFTCATTAARCHASACPDALTESTSVPRTAGSPCTGIATSVEKAPEAEVWTTGPDSGFSPPSFAEALSMRA